MAGFDKKDLPGLKEADIARLGSCAVCHLPLLPGALTFYEVTIRRAAFDPSATQRRVGLGMMLGGGRNGHALAAVMGPDEDLAKVFEGPATVAIHEGCASDIFHLAMLLPEAEQSDTITKED